MNEQRDEEGTTDGHARPEVWMSAEAIGEALRLQAEHPEWVGKPLRLYLEGNGCDGFYYGVAFDEACPGDRFFPQGPPESGVLVVVDPDTIEFVAGSEILWIDDERGRGFLVENPQHREFRGKFYRRSRWQEKLAVKAASRDSAQEAPPSQG